MTFRERLRDQIDYCGLLDKEVASRAGITKRAIDSYVGSEACMPSAEVAVRLAKVLGVTVEYLVTGETGREGHSQFNVSECIQKYIRHHKMIDCFDSLPQKVQISIENMIMSVAESAAQTL